MSSKRLLSGILLLTALVIINGCTTTGKSKDSLSSQFKRADYECKRFGHVSGTDGYTRCIYKRLGLKNLLASVGENGEVSEDQQIVCRRIVYTGSRLKHTICSTTSEWAMYDLINDKKVDEFEQQINKDRRTYMPPAEPDSIGHMTR